MVIAVFLFLLQLIIPFFSITYISNLCAKTTKQVPAKPLKPPTKSPKKIGAGGGAEPSADNVKFELNIKKKAEEKDNFDDDEENPLVNVETKNKKKAGTSAQTAVAMSTSKVASNTKTTSKMPKTGKEEPSTTKGGQTSCEGEKSLFNAGDPKINRSCYQFEKKKGKKGKKG